MLHLRGFNVCWCIICLNNQYSKFWILQRRRHGQQSRSFSYEFSCGESKTISKELVDVWVEIIDQN